VRVTDRSRLTPRVVPSPLSCHSVSELLAYYAVIMAEDGFRLDRLFLTTDTTYIPAGYGPAHLAPTLCVGVQPRRSGVAETQPTQLRLAGGVVVGLCRLSYGWEYESPESVKSRH
jgi:hypothetical protein